MLLTHTWTHPRPHQKQSINHLLVFRTLSPPFNSFSIMLMFFFPLKLTYGDQFDVLPVQELQRHGHILQLHLAEVGPGVMLSVHLLLTQYFQERDELEPIAKIPLQVGDGLVDALQVLVAPPGEGVLLDLLPGRVLGQVLLRGRHLVVLLVSEVCALVVLLLGRLLVAVVVVAHHGGVFFRVGFYISGWQLVGAGTCAQKKPKTLAGRWEGARALAEEKVQTRMSF